MMIGDSLLEHNETNATDENIEFDGYDEYQTITGTRFNSAGQISQWIYGVKTWLRLRWYTG